MVKNEDQRPKDYKDMFFRPSHADYTYQMVSFIYPRILSLQLESHFNSWKKFSPCVHYRNMVYELVAEEVAAVLVRQLPG